MQLAVALFMLAVFELACLASIIATLVWIGATDAQPADHDMLNIAEGSEADHGPASTATRERNNG